MTNTNFEYTHFMNLFWLPVTFFLTSPDFFLTHFSYTIFIFPVIIIQDWLMLRCM